ncbi:MurR/RpiR family transcriptional regulator [Arthrobacter sp. HMWF013]|uniref:MurR/RpiR family transcriptional regulator n=1 Tax=Arthrobacter sp. HMWF013 TaxID=2056849 RepID=UPI000D387767|nr:MurR/RpiR family transcriptional regulator [Arthrobacter sp. HMWF013]PTT68767.1 MurR/RpiR family transcriptional regulator [Arthrobacter sp. HMWF013]
MEASLLNGRVPVFENIRRRLSDMTTAERKIARVLLGGPATIGLETSTKLARQAGVSGPTVIRFVNHLGFATYMGFQEAVRDEVIARVTTPVELFPKASGASGAADVQDLSDALTTALSETLNRLSSEDIDAAAELLVDPKQKVLIFGGWFSSSLAQHFCAMLQELRAGVEFVDDSASRRVAALCDADRRTTAVAFDFRRYEARTEKLGRAVVEHGGKLILFTDQWLSPLADAASAVLPASVGTARPFESYVSTMAVVEALTARVLDYTSATSRSRFERYGSLVDTMVPHPGFGRGLGLVTESAFAPTGRNEVTPRHK